MQLDAFKRVPKHFMAFKNIFFNHYKNLNLWFVVKNFNLARKKTHRIAGYKHFLKIDDRFSKIFTFKDVCDYLRMSFLCGL